MALHSSIDLPLDPNRINGLVAEDRIRTTLMFLRGNIATRPTHPIDISPAADLIQNLPTHVKTVKQTYTSKGEPRPLTIDMACAHQLFSHVGYHRLLVMVYEPDYEEITGSNGKIVKRLITHRDENGKKVPVWRYDRIIEIILSDDTWKAMRGRVTRVEIGRLRSLLLAWDPEVYSAEEAEEEARAARERFHPMTRAMRPRQGLAHPSVKISMAVKTLANGRNVWKPDNKRVQSSIALSEVVDHVAKVENDGSNLYRGLIEQPRVIEYRSDHAGKNDFHGLKLPWRTTGRWPRLEKVGKTFNKVEAPAIVEKPTGDAIYTQSWQSVATRDIPDCQLTIMRHEDQKRTLYADSSDNEVLKHVSRVCRHVGGKWIDVARCWLLDSQAVKRAVESLDPRPLPEAPTETLLSRVTSDNPNLLKINTVDGTVIFLRLESGKWVLKPDGRPRNAREKAALQTRIDAACRASRIHHQVEGRDPIATWYYSEKQDRWNWLINQRPEDAVERIAAAIIAFDYLGPPDSGIVKIASRNM